MTTYREIQDYIKVKYGYSAQSCWIAHVKKLCGIEVRLSPNRIDNNKRVKSCPVSKVNDIKEALRYFNMI